VGKKKKKVEEKPEKWIVDFTSGAFKGLEKLRANGTTKDVAALMDALVVDLQDFGPKLGRCRQGWKNYSKLSKSTHHCHLNYNYVACWEEVGNKLKLVEVYYVGSREKAPY